MNGRQRDPDELNAVERELRRYADLNAGEAPPDFTERVMNAVESEPTPRRGLLAMLGLSFGSGGELPRMLLVGGTMALAVLAVVVAGQLGELFRSDQVGPSPAPSVIEVESVSPSPTEASPSPTATPSATQSPSPTPIPSGEASASPDDGSPPPATPGPSGSPDDDDDETPEPSNDQTPEPADDDNSGPGSEGD